MKRLALATALMLTPFAAAHAASWTIDPAGSHIDFTGKQSGAPFTGHFGKFSGTIDFDPAHPEAGHATITIQTGSATTGDAQKDGAMPGSDWFAADKFPDATFTATSFKAKGANDYEAAGTLSIRGKSKPLTLPFTLLITGDTAKAVGHVQLIRTDYGVGQGSWATAQYVALEVAVEFSITAKKTS